MRPLNKNTQRIFDMTEQELTDEIQLYFDDCDEKNKPYLNIGLANHLKLHKQTVYEIRNDKTKKFEGTHHKGVIEMAHQMIEQSLAERLFSPNAKTVTGSIFTLKSNFDWSEKQQIDMNHNGTINISFDD